MKISFCIRTLIILVLLFLNLFQPVFSDSEMHREYILFESITPLEEMEQEELIVHSGYFPSVLDKHASRMAKVVINNAILSDYDLAIGDKLIIELFDGFQGEVFIDHFDDSGFAYILEARTAESADKSFFAAISERTLNAFFSLSDTGKYYFILYLDDLGTHFLYEVPAESIEQILSPAYAEDSAGQLAGSDEQRDILAQGFIEALEWQTFQLVNSERTTRGLHALQMDFRVREMARHHSKDMGDNNFFSHTSPRNGSFGQRLASFNISYTRAGENLAWNNYPAHSTAQVAVQGWMNSAGHRNNILSANYLYTGMGVYRTAGGRYYYTQVFIQAASPPSYIISPTQNYTLTVNSVNPSSGVEITTSIGYHGTTSYSRSLAEGTTINLTAPLYVSSGSNRKIFSSWSGSVSSSNRTIGITMNGNRTVTANYVADPGSFSDNYAFGFYDHADGRVYIKYDHRPGAADATYRLGPRGNNWQVRVGDFNGDGKKTFGFYDRVAGQVYVKYNHSPGAADVTYRLGPRGNRWAVFVGDFNGDGIDTFGFYDHADGRVYVKYDHKPGAADATYRLGPRGNSWQVRVGDYNGDGKDTFGFYDQADGRVYVKYDHSPGAADATYRLGPRGNNWEVRVGDYNGNGKDTFGFYDRAGGRVYVKYDHSPGAADATYRLGPARNSWEVLTGDFNGNNADAFGFYDHAAGRVYVKYDHGSGAADATYRLGPRGNSWEVLSGKWQ